MRINIAQRISLISRAISALESELGIRLFQRSTRRIEATEAGQLYFARIEPVVDELQHARDMAIDISEQPRGRLRISAPVSFGQLAIVPFLPELTEVYPELFIELILQDSVDDLLAEHFDIALRLGPLKDSAFIASRLCDMRFVVCASAIALFDFQCQCVKGMRTGRHGACPVATLDCLARIAGGNIAPCVTGFRRECYGL